MPVTISVLSLSLATRLAALYGLPPNKSTRKSTGSFSGSVAIIALYFSIKCSPPSPGKKVTTWQFSSSPYTIAAELTISSENLPCVATIMWVMDIPPIELIKSVYFAFNTYYANDCSEWSIVYGFEDYRQIKNSQIVIEIK